MYENCPVESIASQELTISQSDLKLNTSNRWYVYANKQAKTATMPMDNLNAASGDHYAFYGWTTDSSFQASSGSFKASDSVSKAEMTDNFTVQGSNITIHRSTTLYPVYVKATAKITYDNNSGGLNSHTTNVYILPGKPCVLLSKDENWKHGVSTSAYTFAGWSKTKTGDTDYTSATVDNAIQASDKMWTENEFVANGFSDGDTLYAIWYNNTK